MWEHHESIQDMQEENKLLGNSTEKVLRKMDCECPNAAGAAEVWEFG